MGAGQPDSTRGRRVVARTVTISGLMSNLTRTLFVYHSGVLGNGNEAWPNTYRHHDLLQGIDQNVARWNPGSPENCQRYATQHGSCKRDSRPCAFPNLNEAGLGRDDGKFL